MRQGHALGTGIDDQPPHGLKIIAVDVKSAFDLGRRTAFDLDGPKLGAGQFEQQIDLRAGRRSIVERSDGWRSSWIDADLLAAGVVECTCRGKIILPKTSYAFRDETGVPTRKQCLDREAEKELLFKHQRSDCVAAAPVSELLQQLKDRSGLIGSGSVRGCNLGSFGFRAN